MFCFALPASGPIGFASAGQFVARGRPIHPKRRLDSHVLLVGRSGEYPIVQGSREYVLSENTFLLLPAGLEHAGTAPASEGQSHLWCHFHAPEFQFRQMQNPFPESGILLPEFGRIAHIERIMLLFRQLIDAEYRTYADPAAKQHICDHFVAILLTELSDECRRDRQAPSGEKGRLLVSRMEEWIKQHACEGIRPGDVAIHFQYSSDYLSQLMRAATGLSLERCICRHRLREAKHLLLETDLRIHEIARLAGFSDSKYFMKVFRQSEGLTPSEYRQSCNHLHINSR